MKSTCSSENKLHILHHFSPTSWKRTRKKQNRETKKEKKETLSYESFRTNVTDMLSAPGCKRNYQIFKFIYYFTNKSVITYERRYNINETSIHFEFSLIELVIRLRHWFKLLVFFYQFL
jgi:hypothetical protein